MDVIPIVRGLISRRILVNFRVDAEVMRRQLPSPFRPKLLDGEAVAGICLIRLERVRPRLVPVPVGASSENAAHRVAVEWDDATGRTREAVYVPRRDSSSPLNWLLGGRVFPGEQHQARFTVRETPDTIALAMRSVDGHAAIDLRARLSQTLPHTSRFPSLVAASAFFAAGSVSYSARERRDHLDGLRLDTRTWAVEPLAVEHFYSSYFADERLFPPGAVTFDCALLMRDIEHAWCALPPMRTGRVA
jgi:hypothetical protein